MKLTIEDIKELLMLNIGDSLDDVKLVDKVVDDNGTTELIITTDDKTLYSCFYRGYHDDHGNKVEYFYSDATNMLCERYDGTFIFGNWGTEIELQQVEQTFKFVYEVKNDKHT